MRGPFAVLVAVGALSWPLETLADDGPVVVLPPSTQLETRRVVDEGGVWDTVCSAPCARAVAVGNYRIVGAGMTPSVRFRLEGTDPVWVSATPRSWVQVGAGAGITTLGALALLSGGALAFYGSATGSQEPPGAHAGADLALAGGIVAGVGLLALAIGIIVLVDGAHSGVRLDRTR